MAHTFDTSASPRAPLDVHGLQDAVADATRNWNDTALGYEAGPLFSVPTSSPSLSRAARLHLIKGLSKRVPLACTLMTIGAVAVTFPLLLSSPVIFVIWFGLLILAIGACAMRARGFVQGQKLISGRPFHWLRAQRSHWMSVQALWGSSALLISALPHPNTLVLLMTAGTISVSVLAGLTLYHDRVTAISGVIVAMGVMILSTLISQSASTVLWVTLAGGALGSGVIILASAHTQKIALHLYPATRVAERKRPMRQWNVRSSWANTKSIEQTTGSRLAKTGSDGR